MKAGRERNMRDGKAKKEERQEEDIRRHTL